IDYTERVRREQYTTDNHDVGFIIMCSFGKGVDNYNSVIIQAARSLATRYNEKTGVIRSWSKHRKEWQYPVIIDNMMNLELLMRAAKLTDNKAERKMFERIATNHADNTVKNHFRTDYSSCHLVDYDTITGKVRGKYTVQGYADSSAWARGQAWALYGYTMMYRETGTKRYLQQAENIARFIIEHPHLPNDKIPYWDFDAPDDSPRDASSAAIMASAFIELSSLTKNKELAKNILQTAKTQLLTLSSPEYFAEPGTNGNFILKHSVGHFSENSEVDVPLTYADYYYVEAMIKYKQLVISN
ncbi:MAG: glycoside hydrolase family 88 protein, partial [Prevotellaceae bacterium]|nr:glycoside hydrolase family 88 protein [Prevotellaceae bacterium]